MFFLPRFPIEIPKTRQAEKHFKLLYGLGISDPAELRSPRVRLPGFPPFGLKNFASSSSADGDVLGAVEGLVGTLEAPPEHQKAIQPAVDLIKQQLMGIWQLREALVHVHT